MWEIEAFNTSDRKNNGELCFSHPSALRLNFAGAIDFKHRIMQYLVVQKIQNSHEILMQTYNPLIQFKT